MPLIITNVWQGTRTVNVEFIELAPALCVCRIVQVMTKIYLPTILSSFLRREPVLLSASGGVFRLVAENDWFIE